MAIKPRWGAIDADTERAVDARRDADDEALSKTTETLRSTKIAAANCGSSDASDLPAN